MLACTNGIGMVGRLTCFHLRMKISTLFFFMYGWKKVWNMEDTISINHNWFNGENLSEIWAFLAAECMAVRETIAYCRDCFESQDPLPNPWERHCEVIMRANSAINMSEFYQLLMEKKEEVKGRLLGSTVKVMKVVKAPRLERALRQVRFVFLGGGREGVVF